MGLGWWLLQSQVQAHHTGTKAPPGIQNQPSSSINQLLSQLAGYSQLILLGSNNQAELCLKARLCGLWC